MAVAPAAKVGGVRRAAPVKVRTKRESIRMDSDVCGVFYFLYVFLSSGGGEKVAMIWRWGVVT